MPARRHSLVAAIGRNTLAAAWCTCLCVLCACSERAVATGAAQDASSSAATHPATLGEGEGGQDRQPPQAMAATVPESPPFATAPRVRVTIRETVTGHGEPLELGDIELPAHWKVVEPSGMGHGRCASWQQCVIWEAASPDGSARIALLSPRRGFEEPGAGEGSAQSRIALAWLRAIPGDMPLGDAGIETGTVPAAAAATRKRWSAGGAWLSRAHDGIGGPMRELRAMDVETDGSRRLHRVQSWPMLILFMPDAQFDATVAEAVRTSLRIDPAWVAQWWLAWELRTIGEECTLGYHRGDCHVQEGYADYFRAGDGMGLWDVRSDSAYGRPEEPRYDARR